ncbi:MAG: hypothetical protein QM632_06775, partial [Micrococcaceae bacterium]
MIEKVVVTFRMSQVSQKMQGSSSAQILAGVTFALVCATVITAIFSFRLEKSFIVPIILAVLTIVSFFLMRNAKNNSLKGLIAAGGIASLAGNQVARRKNTAVSVPQVAHAPEANAPIGLRVAKTGIPALTTADVQAQIAEKNFTEKAPKVFTNSKTSQSFQTPAQPHAITDVDEFIKSLREPLPV